MQERNVGKIKIFALIISILSLVFLLYISENVNPIINIEDPGLEEVVREKLDRPVGEIYQTDINIITELDAFDRNIESLKGLEDFVKLAELNLEDNFVKDLTPLANLKQLKVLNLRNNEIVDLEDINFYRITSLNLRELNLRHNVKRDEEGNAERLSDISLIGEIKSLEDLSLRDNHIEDLRPLKNLISLESLDIRENRFTDIEVLSNLKRLKELNLRENDIDSIEVISNFRDLEYLNIHSNTKIKSLDPIKDSINLETLIMRNVDIGDQGYIFKDLVKLDRLNAIDTGIENVNPNIFSELIKKGALQGDVRPYRLKQTLDKPIVDKESGFYKERFFLTIDTENATYYTLDGSEPNRESIKYENPIEIKEKDNNSATVIRLKSFDSNNQESETITKTYFVNENIDERFTLPIFSLVTDPDNLFDEEIGIYHENNYEEKGKEWERPVSVEFFERDGNKEFSQNLGLRIHGDWSRIQDQKSFRLIADDLYDKENFINYDFFNEDRDFSFKSLVLRNSGNDWSYTMFIDGMMQTLVKDLETFSTQDYQPSVVFVNGEYYGIYNIRENYDEQYFKNHYGIEENDLTVLKRNSIISIGGEEGKFQYNYMLNYIENNDITNNKHLEYLESLMDFSSFIDYFASQIYFANLDWPQNNIRYWRKNNDDYKEDAPFGHDGRWRWAMYDTDFGFGYEHHETWGTGDDQEALGIESNTIDWVMLDVNKGTQNEWPNFLFRNIIKNLDFRNKFLTRFNDLINTNFKYERVEGIIDSIASNLDNEIDYQIERWEAIKSKDAWYDSINTKYEFAKNRPKSIRKFIQEEFNLNDLITISLSNENKEGYIKLNGMDIIDSLPGNNISKDWKGEYFAGIPITLQAIPKKGYEFSHWEGLDFQTSEKNISINPEGDLYIKAIFK